MFRWKNFQDMLILQIVNYDNEAIREIQIDMIINEKYRDKEKAKETILLQINKWYKDNLNIDKETIETFLYMNDYCLYKN